MPQCSSVRRSCLLVYNKRSTLRPDDDIVKGRPASVATYSTFATFPAPYFGSVLGPLIDQIVGTFFLLLFIFAVVDGFNLGVKANLHPFIIGMVVMAVGISFGANAGYAINPARDFGPRIFAWIAGWARSRCQATTPMSAATSGCRSSAPDRGRARGPRVQPRHPRHLVC